VASIWFGTRGYETWVKAPMAGGDHSRVGFSGGIPYLNGGAGVVASQSAHREYAWTWSNGTTRDELRAIIDFAEGVYDSQDGINLIYFIDQMTYDTNVLPQHWATPSLGANDGMPLLLDVDPNLADTPANELRYPARGAVYTVGTERQELYIPIPPGYVAWVGVHGSATGAAAVEVTPVRGYASGAPFNATLLGVTDQTRVVDQVAASDSVSGLTLTLSVTASDVLTIYGLIVQVLPAGAMPKRGGFISGQGHSGCQFAQHPTETPYSSLGAGAVGATAKLVETGAWLNG